MERTTVFSNIKDGSDLLFNVDIHLISITNMRKPEGKDLFLLSLISKAKYSREQLTVAMIDASKVYSKSLTKREKQIVNWIERNASNENFHFIN